MQDFFTTTAAYLNGLWAVAMQIFLVFIGAFVGYYFYGKKQMIYQKQLEIYLLMSVEMAQTSINNFQFNDNFKKLLNQLVLVGSDQVANEILKLNNLIEEKQNKKETNLSLEEMKPLILAMRQSMHLLSCRMHKREMRFFK